MDAPFYYDPRTLTYDFGPAHPLKPERLSATAELLSDLGVMHSDPGVATVEDALRVHSESYIERLRSVGSDGRAKPGLEMQLYESGLGTSDDPLFPNMFEAALEFAGGSVAAARHVRDGGGRAMTLAGGLHHATRDKASGFCLISDPSIAIAILRERFERVAYVDIDLHHGDGVQWIWYEDPTVLTLSIHQDGRTLYPGTGFVEETGSDHSSINIPLPPGTTGDAWIEAFQVVAESAFEQFSPQAIVLQMGSDPHILDPLGHLQVAIKHWLQAVKWISDLGLPLVACGGGGYYMPTVLKMWTGAILTLQGRDPEQELSSDLAQKWGIRTLLDDGVEEPPSFGCGAAEEVIAWHRCNSFYRIATG